MLRPAAAVSAAVAAWLLTGLSLGLSLPAAEGSQAAFSLCRDCFHRQIPPVRAAWGAWLQPLCHRVPGGQAFATLHHPTCDTAVYTALRLGHGWPEKEAEGEGAPVTEGEEDALLAEVPEVMIPAFLKVDGQTPPSDSALQLWDSLVTALVQSSVLPRCTSTGGDLYILTGSGIEGSEDDGADGCKAGVFWSAVCCAASEGGEGGFSVGLLGEGEGGERVVGVKHLEELLGVDELFSEGCGGTSGETEGDLVALLTEALPGVLDQEKSHAPGGEQEENAGEVDDKSEEPGVTDDVAQEASGQPVDSESLDASADNETEESGSTLVYIISTSAYLLTAPLRPVVSTLVEFPGQVGYVLQEDLGVLSALPGETLSVFHLLASDVVSGVGTGIGLLLGVGESCFSGLYYCASSMGEALFRSCQTGVVGVGTLASDTMGILGGTVDNTWWLTKVFGGQLWEQSEGYVEAVVSEMGGQLQSVGGGLGHLAWRGGNGVGNVVSTVGGLITGSVDKFIGSVTEAFGQENK
ncbi:uncharacterized protein FYW47_006749 [Aplochiton taeniatus]